VLRATITSQYRDDWSPAGAGSYSVPFRGVWNLAPVSRATQLLTKCPARLPPIAVKDQGREARLRYHPRFEKVRVGQAIAGGFVKANCRMKVRAPSDEAPGNAWRT